MKYLAAASAFIAAIMVCLIIFIAVGVIFIDTLHIVETPWSPGVPLANALAGATIALSVFAAIAAYRYVQRRSQMILYHVTSSENAAAIKRDGFRDTDSGYMNEREYRGVWLMDRPLDANEGASGDTVIAVEIPLSEAELDQYKWKEEGKGYREWLVPASVINEHWWPK